MQYFVKKFIYSKFNSLIKKVNFFDLNSTNSKNEKIKVYYRLSNSKERKYKKKLPNATKTHCLKNCIREFGVKNITVIADNINNQTRRFLKNTGVRYIEVNYGSGARTFRKALNLAITENNKDSYIYLLEDDFLHLSGSAKILKEGIEKFGSYITLYDHPDKYINASEGGNPLIKENSELTRLSKTDSVHWKSTDSTVMSFATLVSRLESDYELLMKYSANEKGKTRSNGFFTEIKTMKKINVYSCLPGYSTHCEIKWLTPFVNWEKV